MVGASTSPTTPIWDIVFLIPCRHRATPCPTYAHTYTRITSRIRTYTQKNIFLLEYCFHIDYQHINLNSFSQEVSKLERFQNKIIKQNTK